MTKLRKIDKMTLAGLIGLLIGPIGFFMYLKKFPPMPSIIIYFFGILIFVISSIFREIHIPPGYNPPRKDFQKIAAVLFIFISLFLTFTNILISYEMEWRSSPFGGGSLLIGMGIIIQELRKVLLAEKLAKQSSSSDPSAPAP